jgi:hypothetical protein
MKTTPDMLSETTPGRHLAASRVLGQQSCQPISITGQVTSGLLHCFSAMLRPPRNVCPRFCADAPHRSLFAVLHITRTARQQQQHLITLEQT